MLALDGSRNQPPAHGPLDPVPNHEAHGTRLLHPHLPQQSESHHLKERKKKNKQTNTLSPINKTQINTTSPHLEECKTSLDSREDQPRGHYLDNPPAFQIHQDRNPPSSQWILGLNKFSADELKGEKQERRQKTRKSKHKAKNNQKQTKYNTTHTRMHTYTQFTQNITHKQEHEIAPSAEILRSPLSSVTSREPSAAMASPRGQEKEASAAGPSSPPV